MKNETVTTMSLKTKALLATIPTLVLSVGIMLTINWLITVISSSLTAIVVGLLVWGYIIYRINLAYIEVQKVLD